MNETHLDSKQGSDIPFCNKWIGPLMVKNDLDSIKGDQNLLNKKLFWKTVNEKFIKF